MNKGIAMRFFPVLLAVAMTNGCTLPLIDYSVLSTQPDPLPESYEEYERVHGEDCAWLVFIPFGVPSMTRALEDALQGEGRDYDALTDGRAKFSFVPFPISKMCMEISGKPVRKPEPGMVSGASVAAPTPATGESR